MAREVARLRAGGAGDHQQPAIAGADEVVGGVGHPQAYGDPADGQEQRALRASGCSPLAAVHLAAFGGALVALTGEAAAHGRQLTTSQPGTIQVASRGASGRECPAWITASQAELASCDEIDVIRALPMVFVPRLLADLSASWKVRATRHRDLVRLAAAADGRRALSPGDLDAYLQSRGRFVGAPALRRVAADLAGTLSHSTTEARARKAVKLVAAELGLHVEDRPYLVMEGGVRIGEADIAIVTLRYDCEIDGPHHRLGDQPGIDRIRDQRMRSVHWTVDRHPTEEIDHDLEGFKRSVRRELLTLLERHTSVAVGLGGRSSVRETSFGLGGRS